MTLYHIFEYFVMYPDKVFSWVARVLRPPSYAPLVELRPYLVKVDLRPFIIKGRDVPITITFTIVNGHKSTFTRWDSIIT